MITAFLFIYPKDFPILCSLSWQLSGRIANPRDHSDPVYPVIKSNGHKKKYHLVLTKFQQISLNPREFPVFPGRKSNSRRFPVFPEVVECQSSQANVLEHAALLSYTEQFRSTELSINQLHIWRRLG